MSSIDSTTSANLTSFFKSELTLSQPSSVVSGLGGSVANTSAGATALATTNGAVFQMASLMQRVRSLSSQAGMLSSTNTAGLASLRTQVSAALTQFNAISTAADKASGATTAAAAATVTAAAAATVSTTKWINNFNTTFFASPAPAAITAASGATLAAGATTGATTTAVPRTLNELKADLADMQNNLHDNISKLGVSIQKALSYDSALTGSSTSSGSAASTAYGSNSLTSLWAAFAKNAGSSYL